MASVDVAIDEPALSASTKEDPTTTGGCAAVDDRRLRHQHSQLVTNVIVDAKEPVSWHGVESLGSTACQPDSLRPSYASAPY